MQHQRSVFVWLLLRLFKTAIGFGALALGFLLLDCHYDQVEKQLNQLAKQEERIQLLMTIPGVGRRTAEVIVAALDKPECFTNARQVSAYAGLVADQRQSGQTN